MEERVKEYICTTCGKSFKGEFSLNYHIENMHKPHPYGYACPKCGNVYEHDWELEDHLTFEHPQTEPSGLWWLAILPPIVLVVVIVIMFLAHNRETNGYLMLGFAVFSGFSGGLSVEKGFHPKTIYSVLAAIALILGVGALICGVILLAPFGFPDPETLNP